MYEIALAYSNKHLGDSIDYAEDFLTDILTPLSATGAQKEFETLQNFPPEIEKENSVIVTLTGKKIEHVKWKRKIYNAVIDSTELSGANIVFLQKFFEAEFKYIAFIDGTDWGSDIETNETMGKYIQVLTEDKVFPIKYNENIIYLPEATFKLPAVNPY